MQICRPVISVHFERLSRTAKRAFPVLDKCSRELSQGLLFNNDLVNYGMISA